MAKEGSTIAGLMECFGTVVSVSLQHGVPLKVLCDKLSHTRFEPSGWTGNEELGYAKWIMDYLFRWIELPFLSGKQLALFTHQMAGVERQGSEEANQGAVGIAQYLHDNYEDGDAPLCVTCGSLMLRNGSCHKCVNCGRYERLLLIAERVALWYANVAAEASCTVNNDLRDDPKRPKLGELLSETLMRVDTICEAGLADLDCLKMFLAEVKHPVHKRPVSNLFVWRCMQPIASHHRIPQRPLFTHLRNSRHGQRLCDGKIIESSQFVPKLPPAIDIPVRHIEDLVARLILAERP